MSSAPAVVVDGLVFPEGLRWHAGLLFFSDVFDRTIQSVRSDGKPTWSCRLADMPSGLGWLPDGTLLAVGIGQRALLQVDQDGTVTRRAGLREYTVGKCNDMIVDRSGRAYIGHFGYDYVGGAPKAAATLILVEPDGEVRTVADDLWFPNGMAITADGSTLLVAETDGQRITAFTIEVDGSLRDRRLFAEFANHRPDGVCLDASGALWVAAPAAGQVLRVADGGEVLDCLELANRPSCCVLGGADLTTLYVSCGPSSIEAEALTQRGGHILAVEVDVPGIDWSTA